MRTCLVDRQGKERWEDDDRDVAAHEIHVVESREVVRHYAYVGEFTTKHQSFRRYTERITV